MAVKNDPQKGILDQSLLAEEFENVLQISFNTGESHLEAKKVDAVTKGFLQFTEEEIKQAWTEIPNTRKAYPGEPLWKLEIRKDDGLSNFSNIGGNDLTRVINLKKVNDFVEGNWIIENHLIASGYPTAGKMRVNYWKMIDEIRSTRAVFIVNLAAHKDIEKYGGWFFPSINEKEGLTIQKFGEEIKSPKKDKEKSDACATSSAKQSCKKDKKRVKSNKGATSSTEQSCKTEMKPYYLFHYPYWTDHMAGNQEVVLNIVKELYAKVITRTSPVIVVNCRAGVGRTGTFANLYHFYRKAKESKELKIEDFSMPAIKENVEAFRWQRGDPQFVQSFEQFQMLCQMIATVYNEEVAIRAS